MPTKKGARKKITRGRKKEKKLITHGAAHIQSTFNNTVITITDLNGDTICWETAGTVGFKGSRKSTPFAAQVAAESVARKAIGLGLERVDVFMKGAGSGKETALRTLQSAGLEVNMVTDVTPMPHNGCRPKKKRRV